MDWQAVLSSIDELVFQQTGKHLDSLQVTILKGVLDGQKYAEIAEQYKCTMGHVKDEGYELWQMLSKVLGEDVNKSNFRATVERLGFANYHSPIIGNDAPIIGNEVRVGHFNFCSNLEAKQTETQEDQEIEREPADSVPHEETVEEVLRESKLTAIPQLVQLGLTEEQIAEVLQLPLQDVQAFME
ncbi:hypothetical protein PN462_14075 [Spirulina sp. CS-785/01]|uniref:hypothetical protein n=1 Tax=Spirulina sp. CS-785/01 TaxID=3021716 RepID=UPI00232B8CA5|nr:hypothetical protein [Spirulina sp. CS-785/01]MDB9314236.1 hypothetical protein [Spirulina sp. CS-785/01]